MSSKTLKQMRREGEDMEQSINLLAGHILDGGVVPQFKVRPLDKGYLLLVDGQPDADKAQGVGK